MSDEAADNAPDSTANPTEEELREAYEQYVAATVAFCGGAGHGVSISTYEEWVGGYRENLQLRAADN